MSAVGYYQTDLPFDAIQAFSNLICVMSGATDACSIPEGVWPVRIGVLLLLFLAFRLSEYIHGMVRRAHKQQDDNMNTVL